MSNMQRFGPYADLTEIGRGGMSVVYRATAPDGRLVVLKLMAPHLAGNLTARRRFEMEGRLALNHPNIARVHRTGLQDGTPYIEMEYVAGQTLSELVARQGPLSPTVAARLLADIASALDYAHRQGIIHRDIKPSNIIVRPDGRAVLTDFGVAKLPDATAYTATTARVGSVLFMSPEQAAGAYALTPASDIYSLGVTMYYALTGRTPFQGGTDVAIARQHIEQAPPHPSEVYPALPRAIGDVLMHALAKAPAQRPASAGELAHRFAAALRAAGAPAAPTSGRYSAPSTSAQRKAPSPGLLAGLGSAAALIIVGALIAAPLMSRTLPSTPATSRTTRQPINQLAMPTAVPTQPVPATPPMRAAPSPTPPFAIMSVMIEQPTARVTPTPRARPTRVARPVRPTRQPPDPIPPIASSATLPAPATPSPLPPATPTPDSLPTPTLSVSDTPPSPEVPTTAPEGN